MIGICGAQRVGKSTLAEAFAQEAKIVYLRTSTSAVFAALGKDPKLDHSLEEQVGIQYAILEGLTMQYERAAKESAIWIADRTPVDMAGYMLAAVQRENCTPELSAMIMAYVDKCIEVANRFFSVLMLVQPGITVVEAEGKAPGVAAYQEHMNLVMFGLLMDPRLGQRHFFMRRDVLDLGARKATLFKAVKASLEAHTATMDLIEAVKH